MGFSVFGVTFLLFCSKKGLKHRLYGGGLRFYV